MTLITKYDQNDKQISKQKEEAQTSPIYSEEVAALGFTKLVKTLS